MKQIYLKKHFLEQIKNQFAYEFSYEIVVLPPIFKRYPLFFNAIYPICKVIDNGFSRPVGIVRLNNFGGKRLVKFDHQDFLTDRDFTKKYTFQKDKEYLKATIDQLFVCRPKMCLFESKKYHEKYLAMLKNLVGNVFFEFYQSLATNEIKHTDISPKIALTQPTPQPEPLAIETTLKLQLSNFVKKEIVPEFFGKSAYVRICFYQNFGEMLTKKLFTAQDATLSNLKFETTKCYAKALNELSTADTQTDFLCRLILICLNALLIRERNPLTPSYLEEIKDSQTAFYEEISQLSDEKTKKNLENIMKSISADCHSFQSTSPIFIGYKSIFLQ
ncbi:MAG: hypothetical protein ACI4L7_00710 [Christensenellales bacterium]